MMSVQSFEPVSQDERVGVALAHGMAILPFFGLLAPLVVWLTQREKSPFVRFQALQALFYQGAGLLAFILTYACMMAVSLGSFLAFPLLLLGPLLGGDDPTILPAVGVGLFFLITMLMSLLSFGVQCLMVFGGLAYIAYALFGAVRILRGDDFRYILIGRWLERYLSRDQMAT